VKDHTFISSHVVVSGGVTIGEQCFIGVNATLRDHIEIGDKCVIGAGVLLLESADHQSLYKGTPSVKAQRPSSMLKKI
jgi:carbonic anhydrase/acetyltransferase-like protein (isoleucine patch superfamily)